MSPWIAFLAVGALAGTLAGLLGVGGGLIIVPVLAVVFVREGFSPEIVMQLALGTSLATIVFTSVSSVRAHHQRGAVRWRLVRDLAPGLLLGTGASAFFTRHLPSSTLKSVFGLFALAVAAQMAFKLRPNPHRELPGSGGMTGAGAGIGAISAVVGIGGGSLTVPFLTWCNVGVREAVATSAACGLPIALAGAVGYLAAGWGDPRLPAAAVGYIYWPALAGVAATSVLFAPVGAWAAHRLPAELLKRFFALLLAFIGLRMLMS